MARKLIPLEEAAQMLGITPTALNEMRERHEVGAYKDGAGWKFKADDIERLKSGQGAEPDDDGTAEFAEIDEDQESILLSEVELGGSSPGTSSTIIGKTHAPPTGDLPASPANLDDLDLVLELPSLDDAPAGTPASDVKLPPSDKPSLGDSGLALGEEPGHPGSSATKKGGSALDLGGEDDDLVLGGSGTGSDVTHAPSDSGISLLDPTDSGLSIEEQPASVGGSGLERLDMGGDEMILLEDEKDSVLPKSDDDFLLTPLEDAGEESDSGSQVIALDAEGDFDEAATKLGVGAAAPMLEEDLGPADLGAPALGPSGGLAAGTTLLGAPQAPDVAFSGPNIVLLVLCLIPLMLAGMMMYDLARNMWSWDTPYSMNSSLMDAVLSWFE